MRRNLYLSARGRPVRTVWPDAYHDALLRLEAHLLCGSEIDLRTRLVRLEHLGREDVCELHVAMLTHVVEQGQVAVAQRDSSEHLVEIEDALTSVWPGRESVPDHAQVLNLCFIPQRAIMHELSRRVVLAWEEKASTREDVPKRLKVMFVDGLVWFRRVGIVGHFTGELEVAVSPLLIGL